MKYLIIVYLLLFCCLQANSQDYLQLADECFEKGDYECAKRNYTFFQTFDGRDMSAQIQKTDECMRTLNLADDYFKDEEWEKARERYQIVLEKNPKDPHAKKQLDLCEERLKAAKDRLKELAQEEAQIKDANEEISDADVEIKPFENVKFPAQTNKKPENLRIKKESSSRRSSLLFVAGGVSIAGGIAASLLSTKPYSEVNNGMIINGKEYNFIYAGVGVVAGGLCIGTGIKFKKKERVQPQNIDISYNRSHTPAKSYNYSHLNFVSYGNDVGLRLTF